VSATRPQELRHDATKAEQRLWSRLRDKQLVGWKFRRQVPLGPYIVDFYCAGTKLVVELDGGQHADQAERDLIRTAWLEGQGYRVIRFWNNDVLGNTDGVLTELMKILSPKDPLTPTLPREGGGSAVAINLPSKPQNSVNRSKDTLSSPSPLAGEGWGEGALNGRDPGFAIYVHWPFCKAKCPYCDFNSHVRAAIDEDRWRAALLRELAHFAALTPGRRVTSLFFGGGTPSLMAPATVAAIIDALDRHWQVDPAIEITLEANPTSVEAEKFRAFANAGINRLSLGIQSLNDADLKFLGRQHDSRQALAALDIAGTTFKRFSFDLIYARPQQTIEAWSAELDAALARAGDHLSLYQLTIETGTVFEQAYARGDFVLPPEEVQADLYDLTTARLATAGLVAYEVSNYARPGQESRHNLTYWRYGDYIGVGPGAHGRLTLEGGKIATRQHRAPEAWLDLVEQSGHATRQFDPVTPRARLEEMLLMGLRLHEGVDLDRITAETGGALSDWIAADRLQRLIDGDFLVLDAQCLRATETGRARLDAVLAALV
jgi:oxygen-independent coproporphyrinogen-3 oxidase